MPNKRTASLATLAMLLLSTCWAQDPAPSAGADPAAKPEAKPEPGPTAAELKLDEAVKQLKALDTYAADIRMDVDMLGLEFKITGQYSRKPGNKLLLRLTVEGLGDSSGMMQRSSDGVVLWDYMRIMDQLSLQSVQLAPILKTLQKPEADEEFRELVLSQIGFSGPDSLLSGLRKAGRFDQLAEETYNERPVWVIRGFWKDREALGLPGAQNTMDRSGFLPKYIPSHMSLWIDKETGWPHKVVLQGRVPQQLGDDSRLDRMGRPVNRKLASEKDRPTTFTLNYTRSNRELKDQEFLFQPPPNVNPVDRTEKQAADIENALISYATKKLKDAANKSGEVLDQSLPAPAPNPGEAAAPKPDPGASGRDESTPRE